MKFFTTTKLSENIRETPEGYLVCLGVSIARTGEMIYGAGETPIEPGPDGRVVILRDAAEVFRPETIGSFEGKPFTVLHPQDGLVNPSNWKELAGGQIQNVRRGTGAQDSDLVADILVTDKDAIKLVRSGMREVSCGYEAEYVESGRGRGLQKNIIGNHLALVDEGRAGAAYAINDHKGKGGSMKKTLKERIEALFATAKDEAMKLADEKPEEKKDEPAKDEAASQYDKLCAMAKDFSDLVTAMKPGGDAGGASTQPTQTTPAEVKAKDDESGAEVSLEDRMKKLEEAVAKILEGQSSAGDEKEEPSDKEDAQDAESEEEEVDDASESEEEEVDDAMEGELVGDAAARVEILAPGLKASAKDAKAQALKTAYATTDGKAIIERFTGGKEVDYANQAQVDAIFTGASELLKIERKATFAATRTFDLQGSTLAPKGALSPDEINKKNEAFYKKS